jgi:copper(I)-binding protein
MPSLAAGPVPAAQEDPPMRPCSLLLAAATLALALPAAAQDGIQVEEPFALISPAGNSGAAFMRIVDHGTAGDRLVGAASDVAMRTELHTHVEGADGVMRMLEVEEGFAIPPGGTHLLERGGDHVMLMGLTRPLAEGDVITLTLTFEKEGEVLVEVPVGAPAPGMEQHRHGATD